MNYAFTLHIHTTSPSTADRNYREIDDYQMIQITSKKKKKMNPHTQKHKQIHTQQNIIVH